MHIPPRPSLRGLTRPVLLIWALFLVISATAAFALASSPPAGADFTSTTTSTTAPVGTSTTIAPPDFLNATTAPKYPTPINCTTYGSSAQDCYQRYQADPTGLLPAWRWWTSSILLNTAPGTNPGAAIFMETFDFIASALFAIASVIWFILLSVIKYALDLSLVAAAGNTINRGFAWLSSSITGSGVLLLVLFFALIVAFRMFLKGSVHRLLALMLVVVVPIAAMWTLADTINSHPPATATTTVPTGTPAWLALQGTEVIDYVAGSVASGFGALAPSATANTGTSLSCSNYVDALYAEYSSFSSPTVQGSASSDPFSAQAWTSTWAGAGSTGIKQAGVVALAASSQLWQQAYLTDWVAAQYGSYNQGQNLYCRQLEASANVNPFEQSAIMKVTAGAPPVAAQAFNLPPGVSNDSIRATLFAFDACTYSGGTFSAANGWEYFDDNSVLDASTACDAFLNAKSPYNVAATKSATGFTGTCAFVISGSSSCVSSTGRGSPAPDSIDLNSETATACCGVDSNGVIAYLDSLNTTAVLSLRYQTAIGNLVNSSGSGSAVPGEATVAYNQNLLAQDYHSMSSYWGQNETYAILDGLLSLISAIAYGYALGALALGTILAQIGLVIMLLLLPATLILLAIPTKEGKRIRAGTTLMRTTFGFIISKAMLTIVIVMMLEMILWLQDLIHAGTGPLSGVVNAVIPLAVLYLVKKILSALGLPNLTSLQGAIAMPTAAAMALSGSSSGYKAVVGGLTSALGSDAKYDKKGNLLKRATGLNRLDVASKRAAKAPGIAAWGATKAGGTSASGFLGLDKLRTQMLGRRDAAGNLIEQGRLQQVNSLAALLDIARNNGVAGPGVQALLGTGLGGAFDAYAHRRALEKGKGSFEAASAQVGARKQLMDATRFKSRDERLAIMSQLGVNDNDEILINQRAQRDGNDQIQRDKDGNAIYSYKRETGAPGLTEVDPLSGLVKSIRLDPTTGRLVDPSVSEYAASAVYGLMARGADGSLRRIDSAEYTRRHAEDPNSVLAITEAPFEYIDFAAAARMSASERARLTPETVLANVLDPTAFANHTSEFLKENSLRPGQAVFSMMGHDGIIRPQKADANGRRRLLVTNSAEGDAAAAAYAINYLPNEIIDQGDLTDNEYAIKLNLLQRRIGGIDNNGDLVDVALAHGIDMSTAAGRAEYEAETHGQPSAFDKIQYNISPEEHRATIASARELARGYSGEAMRAGVAIVWGEAATDCVGTAREAKDRLAGTSTRVTSQAKDFAATSRRADALRAQLEQANQAAAAAAETAAAARAAGQKIYDDKVGKPYQEPSADELAEFERLRSIVDRSDALVAVPSQLRDQLSTLDTQMNDYVRAMTADAEAAIHDEATTKAAAEEGQYMFEFAQASAGRKGKKGTTDLGALAAMKAGAAQARDLAVKTRQREIDDMTSTIQRLRLDDRATTADRVAAADRLAKLLATISRDTARVSATAEASVAATIEAGEHALKQNPSSDRPRRVQF